MNCVPVDEHHVPMVWQPLALFPFLDARENVEFGLKMLGIGDGVQLDGWNRRRPTNSPGALSGGQRQCVALARRAS